MARAFIASIPLTLLLVAAVVVAVAVTPGAFGFRAWPSSVPHGGSAARPIQVPVAVAPRAPVAAATPLRKAATAPERPAPAAPPAARHPRTTPVGPPAAPPIERHPVTAAPPASVPPVRRHPPAAPALPPAPVPSSKHGESVGPVAVAAAPAADIKEQPRPDLGRIPCPPEASDRKTGSLGI